MKEILVDASVYISSFFEIIHACFQKGGEVIERNVLVRLLRLSEERILRIIPLEAEFSAHFFASHSHYNLKTADSIVAVTAEAEDIPLVSWDVQLNRVARKRISAHTPTEFLALHGAKG